MPTLPELRLDKFLTQRELAEMIGAHVTQVSDWERGVNRPSMRYLRLLCEALGVGPRDIEWPEPRPKDLAGASPAR
jgi:transcriptional regulator with XRE-family HTH domain